MNTIRIRMPSKVRAICLEGAHTKGRTLHPRRRRLTGDALVLQLMRSNHQFSAKDMNDLADYWEGKLTPQGRPADLDTWEYHQRLSMRVKAKKIEARSSGKRISHKDAIDKVIDEEGFPEGRRSKVANKLVNFMRRSKRARRSKREEKPAQ